MNNPLPSTSRATANLYSSTQKNFAHILAGKNNVKSNNKTKSNSCDSNATIDFSSNHRPLSDCCTSTSSLIQSIEFMDKNRAKKIDNSDNRINSDLSNLNQSQQCNFLAPNICAGCNTKINDRYLLKVADKLWHETCLRCNICECQLNEQHKSLFVKNEKIYCRRDYGRIFGVKGECAICYKTIPAYELIMKAAGNVYHLNCFGCQECGHRFCVGDRFYFDFDNNKILCEYHYKEKVYFAKLSHCTMAQLKRKISHVDGSDFTSTDLQKIPSMKRL